MTQFVGMAKWTSRNAALYRGRSLTLAHFELELAKHLLTTSGRNLLLRVKSEACLGPMLCFRRLKPSLETRRHSSRSLDGAGQDAFSHGQRGEPRCQNIGQWEIDEMNRRFCLAHGENGTRNSGSEAFLFSSFPSLPNLGCVHHGWGCPHVA